MRLLSFISEAYVIWSIRIYVRHGSTSFARSRLLYILLARLQAKGKIDDQAEKSGFTRTACVYFNVIFIYCIVYLHVIFIKR